MADIILSLALPTYNRAKKLSSLLSFLHDEVTGLSDSDKSKIDIAIYDNDSQDDTESVVKSSYLYNSKQVKCTYIKNTSNLGLLGNLNKIYTDNSNGKYIWLLGDDDVYKKGILKKVIGACSENKYSYIFINHTTIYNGNIVQQSVLEDLSPECTDKKGLYELYLTSGTVMMFISACVYEKKHVKAYFRRNKCNLIVPCELSFYCASRGLTKYIPEPLILNDWTDISWSDKSFLVFKILLPHLLLRLPFWGYGLKPVKRAFNIYRKNMRGLEYYYRPNFLKKIIHGLRK